MRPTSGGRENQLEVSLSFSHFFSPFFRLFLLLQAEEKRRRSGGEAEFYPKKASTVAFKERVGNKFLSPLGSRSGQEGAGWVGSVHLHPGNELPHIEVEGAQGPSCS